MKLNHGLMESVLNDILPYLEEHRDRILLQGVSLKPEQAQAAQYYFGIEHPEYIRYMIVDLVPPLIPRNVMETLVQKYQWVFHLPRCGKWEEAAFQFGRMHPEEDGLTLGPAIYFRRNVFRPELMAHALVHVRQFEITGGSSMDMKPYFRRYLKEYFLKGFHKVSFEIEAREKSAKSDMLVFAGTDSMI